MPSRRRSRAVLPPVPDEHAEQVALVRWAALMARRLPALALLYAVPNGGDRDVRVAARLRAEGVRAGVPDLCLPVPRGGYGALYVELKRRRGGRLSPRQREWCRQLREAGNRVEVCLGADEAIAVLEEYLRGSEDRDGTQDRRR